MANLMDNIPFTSQNIPYNSPPTNDIYSLIQRARQDPQGFEQMVAQMNPQAYQQALAIRNSQNPRAIVMEMARTRGVPPDILNLLGIR